MEQVSQKLAALAPADAEASLVSAEIARIVDLPVGRRPFRVTIDPPTTDPRKSATWPTASAASS
jgi:hypothetical protein